MDTTAKKITRACFIPFVFFIRNWGKITIGLIIAGIVFAGAFILPNLHSVPDYIPESPSLNMQYFYTFHTELKPNWVSLGFMNLGMAIGAILAVGLVTLMIVFIIEGISRLYKWSHKITNDKG